MLKMFTHTVSMIILVLMSIGLVGCVSAESANIDNETEHTVQQSQHSDNNTLADQHSSTEEANETVTQDAAAQETAQTTVEQQVSEPTTSDTTTKLVIKLQGGDKELVPICGARVFVFKSGDAQEFSAKTNNEGVAVLRDVPRGKITVQVIASGFKTFGERYELVEKEESIEIELEKRD
jgi:hypothetical protein